MQLLPSKSRRSGRALPGVPRAALLLLTLLCGVAPEARAEVPVQRTFLRLPSSNGHGAVMLDLEQKKVTHFREHLFATEEPVIDLAGADVFAGGQPQVVHSRDLLFDAFFGLRSGGTQRWLSTQDVNLEASGYWRWAPQKTGGTGVATMVQKVGDLEATTFVFAPRALPHAAFVMALRVRNTGTAAVTGVSAFSLHNFHLGFGRPGVMAELEENGETVELSGNVFSEKGFAGVLASRPLGTVARRAAWQSSATGSQNGFNVVNNGGGQDLQDFTAQPSAGTGWATAYQFNLGDLAAGAERWVGVVFAHHGNPEAGATVRQWLADYAGASGAQALVDAEVARWAAFQTDTVKVPAGVAEDEETLVRHSAVVLHMAQVREDEAFLREWLTKDGEVRRTRFKGTSGAPVTLPATVRHAGKGAVLASLPPGQWTYAWIRDGAYAAAAMTTLGMRSDARDALAYYLNADSGRFRDFRELQPYNMPPYVITLTRYHGFGVEETDYNESGPNLEFDGFGLFLWSLRHYERTTGDLTLVDQHWGTVSTKVADALVALIDPATGLIRPDSSIWETHWNGRQRAWAYTSLTAARGLCDAAVLAERKGDADRALRYRNAGESLRRAIAEKLTDSNYVLASNLEELRAGRGYYDAAVFDAFAFGLFDPRGKIAQATFRGFDLRLSSPAGAGWQRNDDRYDHPGGSDVSPWGSEYDSAEWVIVSLRGAMAKRMAGDTERADRVLGWVKDQSLKNYLAVAETYDESTGAYKFNAPMVGFGAGAYALALAHRADGTEDPACGAYFDESTLVKTPDAGTGDADAGTENPGEDPWVPPDAGTVHGNGDVGGGGCNATGSGAMALWLLAAFAGLALALRRRGA
ncbi:glycoside hydrolase family 15 protein [Myxococcus sp. RHSTA-1-4]|uniref:glycoside hydrolase family 15 protein n=1 Tax=Myxococcus sp. RHSTA-1-4 TaxID=2874601 RepID=UPI001CBB4DE4|nr:glycoside hydrolase family 15 protein [Myxococcus sp. RHSTA-1-4]MBZ4422624.1 glycosyl hydrolase [Myxococcus sp. RHSTA-1-4]